MKLAGVSFRVPVVPRASDAGGTGASAEKGKIGEGSPGWYCDCVAAPCTGLGIEENPVAEPYRGRCVAGACGLGANVDMCTDDERRDVAHVAMLACVFGCDALFETGYLAVDANGLVVVASDEGTPGSALSARLATLDGRACLSFTEHSQAYFDWHFSNVWRGVASD